MRYLGRDFSSYNYPRAHTPAWLFRENETLAQSLAVERRRASVVLGDIVEDPHIWISSDHVTTVLTCKPRPHGRLARIGVWSDMWAFYALHRAAVRELYIVRVCGHVLTTAFCLLRAFAFAFSLPLPLPLPLALPSSSPQGTSNSVVNSTRMNVRPPCLLSNVLSCLILVALIIIPTHPLTSARESDRGQLVGQCFAYGPLEFRAKFWFWRAVLACVQ